MSPLDGIRFQPEHDLIGELFERFDLEGIIDHHVDSGGVEPLYDMVLGSQLRLTPILAPRLCTIFEEVRERLAFSEPTDLFVKEDAEINAISIHSLGDDLPHIVSLTSGLVERMDDDELRFVLGHELGHLHFRHYRALLSYGAFGLDEDGDPRMPPLLERRLDSWERLAELSADRAGYLAAQEQLEPVISAFFKTLSGLGPEHLKFDIGAFLDQLADLEKLERRELLSRFSHPATPIRAHALQLYRDAGGRQAAPDALAALDAEVSRLTRLMDFEPTRPLESHGRDFLVAAGVLAGYADGEFSEEEQEVLVDILIPVSADPEAAIAELRTPAEATARMETAAEWLRENAGAERFEIYAMLVHVVAVDGHIDPGEKEFIQRAAELLGVPGKAAREITFSVLSEYLQTKAVRNKSRSASPNASFG